MNSMLSKWNNLKWHVRVSINKLTDRMTHKCETLAMFDPSIMSDNLGDEIIRDYGVKALEGVLGEGAITNLPTHILPGREAIRNLPKYKHKVVCGTNLMSPNLEYCSNWKMPEDLYGYTDVVTLAVGWGYYCRDISKISRTIYRNVLSKSGVHSVRDRYTEERFREMGINNVVFTGCVTLWEMTPERCAAIPQAKAENVIATITDYDRDPVMDKAMLDILMECYNKVFVWIQGKHDLEYLSSIIDPDRVCIIGNTVDQFRNALQQESVDYVGTRLHAGIYALNHGVRSIIIAIDNRASEMGRDVYLPMVQREDIVRSLKSFIESDFKTDLQIPWDNIKKWKAQFRK